MTTGPARRDRAFAVIGWGATVLAAFGAIGLRIVDPAPVVPNNFGFGDLALLGFAAMAIAFASVGAQLVVRRPANAVGWLMVIVGLSHAFAILGAAITSSTAALVTADGDRLAAYAGWLTVIFTMFGGFMWPLLPLIFPTGRARGRLFRGFIAVVLLLTAMFGIQPGPLHLFPSIANPFGVGPDLRPTLGMSFSTLVVNSSFLIAPVIAIVFVSRYRSAGDVERQQLKWFLLASSVAVAGIAIAAGSAAVSPEPVGEAGVAVFGFAGALVPVAIGIAILRHRLYDIDRLISRTVAYVVLTGTLVAIYGSLVIVLGAAMAKLAGGQAIAVAASTLAMAASFGTIRGRVQRAVDRRFDRGRYDANRTVTAFAERLRDEVDLTVLRADVGAVVQLAVAPSRVDLWLRRPSQ